MAEIGGTPLLGSLAGGGTNGTGRPARQDAIGLLMTGTDGPTNAGRRNHAASNRVRGSSLR